MDKIYVITMFNTQTQRVSVVGAKRDFQKALKLRNELIQKYSSERKIKVTPITIED